MVDFEFNLEKSLLAFAFKFKFFHCFLEEVIDNKNLSLSNLFAKLLQKCQISQKLHLFLEDSNLNILRPEYP